MASVQRRTQNGQVRWVVRHRMPDGTQRSRSFIRQRDAQQYRTTVAGDTLAGTIADPSLSKTRFADVAATWQAGRVSLRDTTRAAERSRLESLVLPTFGTYPIGAIEPSDVQTWIAGLDAQGYSAATIAKAYRIVRAVCKVAVRDGKVARSPVESGIELPKATTTPMMVLTTDEIAALADAVGPFWRPLILTAAGTGMRWGELAGLRTE
jgi:integrase